jgi:hypothetical protein
LKRLIGCVSLFEEFPVMLIGQNRLMAVRAAAKVRESGTGE